MQVLSAAGVNLVKEPNWSDKGWEHKTWMEVMTAQVTHKVDESL